MFRLLSLIAASLVFANLNACTKSSPTPAPAGQSHTHADGETHDHDHDHDDHADDHDHDHADDEAPGAHGPGTELGTATVAGWTVRAMRAEGDLFSASESAVDVWLTGGTGEVVAVRLWIGSETGEGSMKAKAESEGDASEHHYHAHVEVPPAVAASDKLWVEIEVEGQGKKAGSFDLKH